MNNSDLFDQYATTYNEALSKALAPSGESRQYFAERRIAWLKRCLHELRQAPQALLDYGCGDGSTPLLLDALQAG